MRVAVVIPCRNESATIETLLDACAAQDHPPDTIVVVDDASVDGTRALVDAWAGRHRTPAVRVVGAPGRGVAVAMNIGIAAAEDADVIVRLDGHCQPSPSYIRRCLEVLERPGAGVSGGVWNIEPAESSATARGIAAVLSHPLGAGGAEYRRAPDARTSSAIAVDTVPFGTFRRELWARLGGFDESLIRNQDYDFNYRVRRAGLQVILDPRIVSVYRPRASFSALARQYFGYGYWKVVMLRKFPASLRARQALPLLLVPVLVTLTLIGLSGRTWAFWLIALYIALNAAGALHASTRARDLRIAPHAFAALLTLQNAWSAGAWSSLLRGARAGR